jgi:uncharacterized protein YaeQ
MQSSQSFHTTKTQSGHPPKAADGMALEFRAYGLHAATDLNFKRTLSVHGLDAPYISIILEIWKRRKP